MRLLVTLALILFFIKSHAQDTDELRLGYELKSGWRQMKVVASPDGRYLAFAYQNFADSVSLRDRYFNKMIRVFDLKTQKYVATLKDLALPVFPLMTFTNTQELLYIKSPATRKDGYKIFSYNIVTGAHTERYTIKTFVDDFNSSLHFSTALNRVLVTSKNSALSIKVSLTVLDPVDSYKEIYTIELGTLSGQLAFEHSSKLIAASSFDQIKLIDLSTGKTINTIKLSTGDRLSNICLDNQGRLGYLFYRSR